jgi:hypothetical protein
MGAEAAATSLLRLSACMLAMIIDVAVAIEVA